MVFQGLYQSLRQLSCIVEIRGWVYPDIIILFLFLIIHNENKRKRMTIIKIKIKLPIFPHLKVHGIKFEKKLFLLPNAYASHGTRERKLFSLPVAEVIAAITDVCVINFFSFRSVNSTNILFSQRFSDLVFFFPKSQKLSLSGSNFPLIARDRFILKWTGED